MSTKKLQIIGANLRGEDGYTPVKGVDYWTDEDKKEITDYVDKEIAEFDFVKVVDTLPETGLVNREYFVRKANPDTNDLFDEYAWINVGTEEEPNWAWEFKGTKKLEIDLSEYVKFTDYGSNNKYGIVQGNPSAGVGIDSTTGKLFLNGATENQIDEKSTQGAAITPLRVDYAVKVGITTNTETLTDEEKTSACDWLGALKKDTSTNNYIRLYAINPDGSQTVVVSSNVREGNAIVRYSADGRIDVGSPNSDYQAANKKFVEDGFVAKSTEVTTRPQVYVKSENGTQTLLTLSTDYQADAIPKYNAGGRLTCADPTSAYNTVNKKYVDGLIAELLARIEVLENK